MLDTIGRQLSQRIYENPIFIVGGSRSGTIVLLKAIGQHPLILSTPSENPFIADVGRLAHELAFASERDRYYYDRSLRLSHVQLLQSLRRLAFESSFGPSYGLKYMLSQIVKERTNVLTKQYWCTKSFPSETTAQGLQALYPNSRFIWILRNGMSVVHSRTKFPEFKDLDFSEHCHHWTNSIMRFAYLRKSDAATVVHQEELTDNPEAIFRKIFQLIDIPYHSAPADFSTNTHVHPLHELGTTTGVNVKEVLSRRTSPHESWPDDQRQTFKNICEEAMQIAGYQIPY